MRTFSCSALLFDLDGVLVDSIPSVERAWRKFGARHGIDPELAVKTAHGHRSIETVKMLMPHLDAEKENKVVEQDEIDDAEGLLPTEGAAELLAVLPPERWTVVTSGTRALATARLRAAGLPMPIKLIAADDVKNGKPDPEPYLKGSEALGFRADDCVVVEDAVSGIRSGHGAGAKVVALVGTFSAAQLAEADVHVNSLAQISVELRSDGLLVRIPD